MRRRRLLTVSAVLALSMAAPARAQGPSADWRTIETRHFRIHYPSAFEAWARRVAGSVEVIHARVTEVIGWSPGPPIEVVVADPEASANGVAMPFLDRPEIVLWTTPPDSESGLGEFGDWMELLTTHEVAHIAHLSRPRNRSRGILARLSPAPLGPLVLGSPRWVIEGYATLIEGALTGSGRPRSSFRAMVLRQLGVEGKLPSYGALDSTEGFLGGSAAYLVGSAYLEWLAERYGTEKLPALWKRMASVRGGGFGASFRGVFGESPADLYDRFRAELTAGALAQEKRLGQAGLVEGELWQRLRGGTSAPQVSPEGSRLLARRDPKRGESELAVWEIAESEEERRELEAERRRDAELAADAEEVPDLETVPRPRRPRWTLPRRNGMAASDPRFMPDGSVLFSRAARDAEGRLRSDLYRWELESGSVARVTRNADVSDADPAPDGAFAVAVRSVAGETALVRVALDTGDAALLQADVSGEEWPIWSRPRVSPDSRSIAALLHRGGAWRLVVLPSAGGPPRELELGASPAGAPAWSADGSRIFVATDASGIWNVAEVDVATGRAFSRTRVTGGAFSPAPTPDGRGMFFLDFAARGVNLRRLDLATPSPAPLLRPVDGHPLLPIPPASASPRIGTGRKGVPSPDLPGPRPYSVWDSFAVRPLVGLSLGPDGGTGQLGLAGDDVLGRLHLLAAGSFGNAPGPRGAAAAGAWRGLPVEISAQVFSSLEKPGRQALAPRPELDQERFGGFAGLAWGRAFDGGGARLEGGGGVTRVDDLSGAGRFTRALGSGRGAVSLRRTRGRSGVGLDLEVSGAAGSTDGSGWRLAAGGARLSGITPIAILSAGARFGGMGGTPTVFDVFAVGGGPDLIRPPGLDVNRIESAAMPAGLQLGEKLQSFRAEIAGVRLPLVLYAEWLRAWTGDARPDPARAVGAEVVLDRLVPAELRRTVIFRAGAAWIRSETPRFSTARGYAALVYRP